MWEGEGWEQEMQGPGGSQLCNKLGAERFGGRPVVMQKCVSGRVSRGRKLQEQDGGGKEPGQRPWRP